MKREPARTIDPSKLKTVEQFAAGTSFSEGQLRGWIGQAYDNGFKEEKVVVRIGRRVFIDPEAFARWLVRINP